MRLLASLEHYVASTDGGGLQLHQYVGGRYSGETADGLVGVSVNTHYPLSGTVRVTVEESPADTPWTLSLRIPEWAAGYQVSVRGQDASTSAAEGGWLRLKRAWSPGDEVVLELAVVPRLVEADPRADALRGCVAVERGPLVYCLEGVDHPGGGLDDVVIDAGRPLTEEQHPELLGGIVTVTAAGHRRTRPNDGWWPYRRSADPADGTAGHTTPQGGDLVLTAVPYYAWANRQDGSMRVWIPTR
jgi:DUF1680 family protein